MAKILVCDDNPDFLEMVEFILKDRGHEVKGIQSGKSIVSMIEDFRPDLLLLDLYMPDMNGYEVMKQIRTKTDLNIPILVFSAMGGDEERKRAISAGATSYITKPFKLMELADAVNSSIH